ncbi:MAG TPA: 2-hydroxymuconate tautomerase [Bacillota bacterium]|nr:2-hydroxymuconate tautomerase [Bacillota bacterium]
MPVIQVHMLEGRTQDQKREIVKQLTDAMVNAAGAKKESVTVILYEKPRGDYGIGGVLFSDQVKP